jgi:hypothetical protein
VSVPSGLNAPNYYNYAVEEFLMSNLAPSIKRVLMLMLVLVNPVIAQNAGDLATFPNLVGIWVGKSNIMLPGGITEQVHLFEFTEQDGVFFERGSIAGISLVRI